MERGLILETLILDHGQDRLVMVDADDWRTKVAKEARDAARAEGRIAVLISKFEGYQRTADAVLKNVASYGIKFEGGEAQPRFEWDKNVGEPMATKPRVAQCKARPDYFNLKAGLLLDLKTTENAHPLAVERKMMDFGYDIQAVAYLEAVETKHRELAGRAKMLFVFAEVDPPYAVTIVEPDGSMLELGGRRWARAALAWEACMRTNVWPSYQNKVYRAQAPTWALNQEATSELLAEEGQ